MPNAAPNALASLDVLTVTDLRVHDPSTLVREGDTYYVLGTGRGLPLYASTDLRRWTPRGRVFDALPAWILAAVPEIRGNFLWAPDIRRVGDGYRVYYAASTFGSNTSAIGLATTRSLAQPQWKDEGMVVASHRGDDFNAIDPAITEAIGDRDRSPALTFGSFWSGIQLIRLDAATGLLAKSAPTPARTHVAANTRERNNPIEAPFVYARDGWFYLFVNWGLCCRGADSTYNIRVGRSRRVDGPYLDRDGVPLDRGGGTSFLDIANADRSLVGPGHAGILDDRSRRDGSVFSCHVEYARANGGRSTLAVARMTWDKDGWPGLRAL